MTRPTFPWRMRAACAVFAVGAVAPACVIAAAKAIVSDTPAAEAVTPASAKARGNAANRTLIERGRYLAKAGDCEGCHTAEGGVPYAGGLSMDTPFGTISTPNITPDRTTGIGTWSDADFYRALHDGIDNQGGYLYPVMPFAWYTQVNRNDVAAIKAYLFSLAPVHKPRQPSHLEFPFSIRSSLLAWRQLFFEPGEFKPDPAHSALENRGDYLVNGLAHCGECHDSRIIAGNSRFQKKLQGGVIDHWYAPNITSDVQDGIGGWTNAELVQYLSTGVAPLKGIAVGPMAQAVHSLQALDPADLEGIAAYLKVTKPVATQTSTLYGNGDKQVPGAQAYLNNCAACHGVDGLGLKGVVPPLKGNGAVLAKGPQNVLQVVLGGLEARQGYAPMLAIGAGMSDRDVADVGNYVRQSWGNAAAPVASVDMAHDLRGQVDSAMNGGVGQACPVVVPSALAKAVRSDGVIGRLLAATTELNMPEQVARILLQSRAALPTATSSQVVNGLTAAYCTVVRADAKLEPSAKALQIGHFSQLVYMQFHSGGLVASAR